MIGSLIAALIFQTQGKAVQRLPDFNNALLSVRYLRQEPYEGRYRYHADFLPYQLSQTFEPYKGPPTNDPGDTKPLTYTLTKPGKGGWKVTGPSDDQTIEVLADTKVAIVYQRWGYNGFTVFNANSGGKLWIHKPTARGKHVGIALIDGVLYLWEKGLLTAMNPITGAPIWSQPMPAEKEDFELPPIQVKNGRIFISLSVKDRAQLSCLDARSGAPIWNRDVGFMLSGFVVTGTKVVVHEDKRIRKTQDPKMTMSCLDASTGDQIWNIPVDIKATLFTTEVSDDVILMPGCRSPSYLYKLSDGKLIKKFDDFFRHKLFGPYFLEIDDRYGLLVILAETGERIGRLELSHDETWDFHSVHDRLLMSYMTERQYLNQVYEVFLTK